MSDAITGLKSHLADVHHLRMATSVLGWDQQTYMPPRGVQARAEQIATLSKLSHRLFTDAETGSLLSEAERSADGLPADHDDRLFLRAARRDFDMATKLPPDLVIEAARVTALAQEEWAKARAADDWQAFAPWLTRILDLTRRTADALGYNERMYDALVDQFEPDITSADLDVVFDGLKRDTVPLARAIFERVDRVDAGVLARDYDEERQREFAEGVLRECGYDFSRGRQDRAVHPFCTHFSRDDVRITTRYDRNFLPMALFGSMHEMGHGLYEQGVDASLEGTLLAHGASLGVHESQSRLWENLVGRSRGFWERYFPRLRETFPDQLAGVAGEEFYRAINRVAPSLIRVEADEITYNLHIILRYELENDLLEGRVSVAEAPDAWNAKMQDLLGITPPNNREGILQDVHWSLGILGYFPTYTLGNILSVQLFEQAVRDRPSIPEEIRNGQFEHLLGWMRENVHRHGRKYLPEEVVERATGKPLCAEPYVAYLKKKFGEIYGLAT